MNESAGPITTVNRYLEALGAGDMATVAGLFAADVVWHQPGANRFSGDHHGPEAVGTLLAGMMAASQGSFRLEVTGDPMANGDLVALPVRFSGDRADASMDQAGIDLLRVVDGRIAEVWLFSADPAAEDAFWGTA